METIATDTVFLRQILGNGVCICLIRHGGMETCIENGDIRLTGEKLLHDFDAGEVCRVVQRAERNIVHDDFFDLFVHQCFRVFRAAQQHSVAHGGDFVRRGNHAAAFGIQQYLDHFLHARRVVGIGTRKLKGLLPVSSRKALVLKVAFGHADAFHQPLADTFIRRHIDDLIFEGRAAAVDNQNFHAVLRQDGE